MKTCSHPNCKQQNPQHLKCFSKRKASEDGLNHWCKDCVRLNNIKCYNADLEKSRKKSRDWDAKHRPQRYGHELKHKFGITVEKYNEMALNQDHKCKICNKSETMLGRNGKVKKLCVDHCHVDNVIRGLLCSKCNTAIGLLYDDIELLQKAIEYIKIAREGKGKI